MVGWLGVLSAQGGGGSCPFWASCGGVISLGLVYCTAPLCGFWAPGWGCTDSFRVIKPKQFEGLKFKRVCYSHVKGFLYINLYIVIVDEIIKNNASYRLLKFVSISAS